MTDRPAGESLAIYIAELRVLKEYCDFGTTIEDIRSGIDSFKKVT